MMAAMRRSAFLRTGTVIAVLGLLAALRATDSIARERLQRRFDLERGLPFSEVYSVRQDTRGFIWIATGGGLFRYDGVELRPWPREPFRPFVHSLATGPAGEVLLVGYTGGLFQVEGDGFAPIEGPAGAPFEVVWPPVWDGRGNLWVLAADRLWYRPPGAAWHEFPAGRIGSEHAYALMLSQDHDILVLTPQGIWRIGPALDAVQLAAIGGVQKALLRSDGSMVVLRTGNLVEIRDGATHELFRYDGRPIDMVEHGRTLWVSYDTALVALTPGLPPEKLDLRGNVPSGGPLLVDREGNLWVGTFRGLLQYPAPETVAWGIEDGLGTNGTRRLASSPEGIWVDTWAGLHLMHVQGDAFRPERIAGTGTGALCVGADGTLWTGDTGRFLEHRGGRLVAHPWPGMSELGDCSPGAGGRVWLSGRFGMAVARGGAQAAVGARDTAPVAVAWPSGVPFEGAGVRVLEDSRGRLWMAVGETICHADARDLAARAAASRAGTATGAAGGARDGWSCVTAEGAGGITSLAEPSPGSVWAATVLAGVFRLGSGDRWEPIPGARELPTRLIRRLRASPSGGAWIISYGTILRAVERPGTTEGWEIVERPSAWHGLMISDAEDILEEDSGDLLITTLMGVVHIPAEVRRAVPPVPSVELVDVLVDGEPVPWRSGVDLPWRRNRIELRFAGLSYRDPGMLRYQVRLKSGAPWIDASGRPSFRFVDLPPGKYHAEVRASLDGQRWSPATAGLSFRVRPPVWRTWWFTALLALAAAAVVYALYRYRLAQVLRLERTRTRIAADLHDDIGASLSRIALQSDLLKQPAVLRPADAGRLLSDIGESARTLVDGMSDIVWSIDPKRDDLASLAARVRQFALGLFEPLGVALVVDVPEDAARVRLGPEQRRHIYLLLKEALNNIARHAAAKSVTVTIGAGAGRLEVEVRDDGRGFAAAPPAPPGGAAAGDGVSPRPGTRGGHGLPSMRNRAAQLGGSLTVASTPGGGTTLRLVCPTEHVTA
jgi:signal transduction histidine kinase/ligand-binding sensor domain-containing protein